MLIISPTSGLRTPTLMNERVVKRELITWLQYFVISFIAAAVAENSSMAHLPRSGVVNEVPNPDAINIRQMMLSMWHGYYRLWLLTFLGLSAVRLVVVFFIRGRQGSNL